MIATDNTVVAYINKQGGTFPPPVAAGSGSVSVVSDSGHNSKSQTYSGLPKCDSRPLVSAEPAHHDRVKSPPRSRESDIQTVGNSSSGQVCHSPQHASSPVHGSSSGSGASSTAHRCFVTGLAGVVNVHVSTISPAQQSRSEAKDHPYGRGDTHRPLVAVVSTPATIECGSPAMILSVPQRPFVQQGYISSGKSYHLHAWRLLCSTTKQQDFQGRSLSLLQLLHVGDPPQIECTMTGGYASLPGLQGEDLIRLSRVTGPV